MFILMVAKGTSRSQIITNIKEATESLDIFKESNCGTGDWDYQLFEGDLGMLAQVFDELKEKDFKERFSWE